MIHPSFDSSRRAGSNDGCIILLRLLDAEIFDETSNGAVSQMLKCRSVTFRQISWRPVVVEGRNTHHSTRLDEPVRIMGVSSFYDHWMLRYSLKQNCNIF